MPKKEHIRNMFDNIATDYDRLNHILSLDIDKGWRKKAVKEIVEKEKEQEILDVASGTGDFAIAIAKAASENSTVTGIDISEGMLAVGEKKIAAENLQDRIILKLGDCENLRFPDSSFDRVSVAFGVRNFEHLDLGLREMQRVLKSGGKAVILELSVPSNPLLLALYKLYFLHILPAIGGIISGDRNAYRYLPASVLKFPKPKVFLQIMQDCGFRSVYSKSFTFGICRMYIGEK